MGEGDAEGHGSLDEAGVWHGPWLHPAELGEARAGRSGLRAPRQVPMVVPGLLNPHREVTHVVRSLLLHVCASVE